MPKAVETLSQEALIAIAILSAIEHPPRDPMPLSIEDISELLFKLRGKGIELGDLALRRVPEGYYSEDVEILVGHYLAAGYASKQSPVTITEAGINRLRDIIADERRSRPEAVDSATRILGLSLQDAKKFAAAE